MSKKYYETISLIEWIYIENENIIIQRDWSKYFDFEIKLISYNKDLLKDWIKYSFINNINSQLWDKVINSIKKSENEIFIKWLHLLLKNYTSFYDILTNKMIFGIDNKQEKMDFILNDRKYIINNWLTNRSINAWLKSYLQSFKYWLSKHLVLDLKINTLQFEISRKFNFKDFFLQNEALFDIDNDFYNTEQNSTSIKYLSWKLKEKDTQWNQIDIRTVENMIKSWEIQEKNIFRVDIVFDSESLVPKNKTKELVEELQTELNIISNDLDQNKRIYNFCFFERNEYLVFKIPN